MYQQTLTIDGYAVNLTQGQSGMGARFTLTCPDDAPESLPKAVLTRTQNWCAKLMGHIPGSTIRATRFGHKIEVEALGAPWKRLEDGFPELEEELGTIPGEVGRQTQPQAAG